MVPCMHKHRKLLVPPTPTTIYLFLFENRDGRMVINKCLFIYSLSAERSTTLQQTVYIKTLITVFFVSARKYKV